MQDDATPAVGFYLYTYLAGTDTPQFTYKDFFASQQNTNPIVLDSHGAAQIYITASAKFILKDLDFVTVWTADNLNAQSADVLDSSGNYLIKFTAAANAVNYITITNAATGGSPTESVGGTDVNIDLTLNGKGTGKVVLGANTSSGVKLAGNQPILDSSNNELLKFTSVSSALNEITISNNSIGLNPILSATGGDTNIDLSFAIKGTGSYNFLATNSGGSVLKTYEQLTNGTNWLGFGNVGNIATNHTLFFDGGGVNRTITVGGDFTTVGTFSSGGAFVSTSTVSLTGALTTGGALTTANAFTTSGANPLTLTTTGSTNVTLPTSGTLVNTARNLTVSGLIVGGGDLSSDRNFDVTAADAVTIATGTSNGFPICPALAQYHNSACKCWVSFTTVTTTAITASYNVTSLTDNGTGNTTINFTTTFAAATYSWSAAAEDDNAGGGTFLTRYAGDTKTGSAFQVRAISDAGSAVDAANQSVHIFGAFL